MAFLQSDSKIIPCGPAKGKIRILKAYLSIFRIKTAEAFQYRIAGLAGATTSIFWALIEITIYWVFYHYADHKAAGIMAGMDLKAVISYTWLAQFLWLMQPMNIEEDILSKITNGDVGIELCRPLDLYFHWFSKIAAARITPLIWRGLVVLLAGMLMPPAIRLSPPASLLSLLCMLLTLITAVLLCTSFGTFVCTVRLNITWGNGPTYIIMLIAGVLSGAYLPLRLWPDFLQKFLMFQPFAGYLDLPLRLYLDILSPSRTASILLLQLVWTLLFFAAGKYLMSQRLKKIIVQGG